ncbi:MAG TPA: hypothetical protein VKB26_07705 [Candidatus Acidoferrales bacterium]|nr:hypothetical protein [Candidatus Acidoferrales bacterium]
MKGHTTSIVGLLCVAALAVPVARAQSANPPAQQSSTSAASTSASSVPAVAATSAAPAEPAQSSKYLLVPTGTKLPLVLHNAVSTRTAHQGDSVYLETLFPIVLEERIVIPAGSYVSGEVTEAKRGRGHGQAEIAIKLNNLILPNGYQAQFDAVPSDAGTGGKETVDREGKIKADKNTAGDAKTVVEGTAVGAGVGGIVTRSATGAGVGAGLGAVAGLITAHLNRPDVELPRGTTLDVVLDRPLYLLSAKINFTSPGQASTLAGPPIHQSQSGIIPH